MPSVKMFTKLGVEKLKLPPGKTQISYFQTFEKGGALVLVVGAQSKTWRAVAYEKRFDKLNKKGKPKTIAHSIKLGRFPQLLPEQARALARAYWEDPEAVKAEAEAEEEPAEANKTFREIVLEWLKREVKGHISRRETERYLGIELERNPDKKSRRKTVYIPKAFHDRKIAEIGSGDVIALLDRIEDNHGKATAERVLGILRRVMEFHEGRNEKIFTSPITPKMKRDKRKAKERRRERVLNKDELRLVWRACEQAGPFGRLLQVCIVSAQRRGKVALMRWSDLKGNVWTIPTEDREKGTAGVIVLPEIAMEIVGKQEDARKNGNPFVFPGRGTKAFNAFSQGKAEVDRLLPADMMAWTIHDLRRTSRTTLSGLVSADLAERMIGHELQGVRAVYDHYDYQDEMAKGWKALAARIKSIVDPFDGNVVPFERAG